MSAHEAEVFTDEKEAAGASFGDRFGVAFALFALYVIWGSTYLAIRVAVTDLPPLLMSGARFVFAGCLLYAVLRHAGLPAPTRSQWTGSAIVGTLLLCGGNGGVSLAEKTVSSSVTATMIATVPLWAALFAGFWGRWPNRMETVGLAVGFLGIVLLNSGGSLHSNPVGAIFLLGAAASWALGSVWSTTLSLPSGLMASAAEMLTGGIALLIVGAVTREQPAVPGPHALVAILYLVVFGSLIAYSAYSFLLQRVRPALATSYAYVNPVVAVLLGVGLAGEQISGQGIAALCVILIGVALVVQGHNRGAGSRENRQR